MYVSHDNYRKFALLVREQFVSLEQHQLKYILKVVRWMLMHIMETCNACLCN